MRIVLFEDSHVGFLEPLILTRPAFALTVGGCSLIQALRFLNHPLAFRLRPWMEELAGIEHGPCAARSEEHDLYINAAALPDIHALQDLLTQKTPFVQIADDGRIVAALIEGKAADQVEHTPFDSIPDTLNSLNLPVIEAKLPLLNLVSDTIKYNGELLKKNLSELIRKSGTHEIQPQVFAGKDLHLHPGVAFDTRGGPVLIGDGCEIGAQVVIEGPCKISSGCTVRPRAYIREYTVLGHTVKVGGEVEATIIEPYSNKQHDGFLGHAHVGSWVNLGAATNNSDLKNTYGSVNIEIKGERLDTGLTFFGCVIGDYAKTAIATTILTGRLIGVNSHLYGVVAENVPAFVNYAKSLGGASAFRLEVALRIQERMFARRSLPVQPEQSEILKKVFELTANERTDYSDIPFQLSPKA